MSMALYTHESSCYLLPSVMYESALDTVFISWLLWTLEISKD